MTLALAALSTAGGLRVYWQVARTCAARRGCEIGSLPTGLQMFTIAGAVLAAAAGAKPAQVLACAATVVAGLVDARTGAIFDPLNALFLISSFGFRVIEGSVTAAFVGSLAAGGSLLALHVASGGHGIGRGDVKLGFALGAALGTIPGLIALGFAFTGGAAYGSWLLATRRAQRGSAIRFGPFIAAGNVLALFARPAA